MNIMRRRFLCQSPRHFRIRTLYLCKASSFGCHVRRMQAQLTPPQLWPIIAPFVDNRMAGYRVEPTPERPTIDACERRVVPGSRRKDGGRRPVVPTRSHSRKTSALVADILAPYASD